ncbi:MAG: PP2C family protein-serine/threonine phosphatase, partial [Bacteroidota bacterium]
VYLVVLLAGLSFIIIGFFIGINRPKLIPARLIGISFVLTGFFIMNLFSFGPIYHNPFFVNLKFIMVAVSGALGFSLLFHNSLLFPKERTELISKRWIWISPYILGGLFFIVWILAYFFLMRKMPGILQIIVLIYGGILVLYKFAIEIVYRKFRPKEVKKIGRTIGILSFFSLIMVIANFVVFYTFNKEILTQITLIPVIFIPFAYLYTIGRYKLLDIEIRIKKNIQYVIVSILVKLVTIAGIITAIWGFAHINFELPNIAVSGTSIEVLKTPLRPEVKAVWEKGLVISFSLLGMFLFLKLNKVIKNKLDKLFYHSSFDYRRAATELFDIFAKNCCISDLAGSLVQEIKDIVKLKRVGIVIFRNEERVVSTDFFGVENPESIREFCLSSGKRCVDSIKEFHGEFRVDYMLEPFKSVLHNFRFEYIVPIRSKEKVIGAIIVGQKLSEASFVREDFELLSSIASQAAVAIENSFLYEDLTVQERMKQELEIARRIQIASLPQKVPDIQGLDISGISIPAFEVGGDFYDFLNGSPDSITIVVGDVSGKGTSAALYMSKIQGVFRTLNQFLDTPKELLISANKLLFDYLSKNAFITVIGAKILPKKNMMILARAGHLPLYLYSALTGEISTITPKGIGIGLGTLNDFDSNLDEIEIPFAKGDTMLFVSDGVSEARNESYQVYDEKRMLDIFKRYINYDSETIRNSIIKSVQEFSVDTEQYDDLTVVVVKVL